MAPGQFDLVIYGLLNSEEYQIAKHCLEDIKRSHAKQIAHSETRPLLEYEWKAFLRTKRAELRGETWAYDSKCMVFLDKQLLGNAEQFLNWAKNTFDHENFRDEELLGVFSHEEYRYIPFRENKVQCRKLYFSFLDRNFMLLMLNILTVLWTFKLKIVKMVKRLILVV